MFNKISQRLCSVSIAGAVSVLTMAITVSTAQAEDKKRFHIPSQPLSQALLAYSKQSDLSVMAKGNIVQNKIAPAISGNMTPDEALSALLENSGLQYSRADDGSITVGIINESDKSGGRQNQKQRAEEHNIEEMVVTARFREETAQNMGVSISALSGSDLSDSGVESFQDLAVRVPGLNVADRGPNKSSPSFRGLASALYETNFQRNNALIGIYLDDVPVVTSFSNQRSWNLFDIDRVEVVRGPQGTLYGEGAMGGAIRYVTKDPSLQSTEGAVRTSFGSTRNGDGMNWRVDGTVGMPLIEDKLGLRLTAFRREDAGFIDNIMTNQKGVNDFESDGFRAVLLAKPTDELSIRLGVTYEKDRSGSEWVITGAPENLINENSFALAPSEDKALLVTNRIAWQTDVGDLISITGFLNRKVRNTGLEPTFTFNSLFPTTKDYPIDDKTFTQELRFVSKFDGSVNFLVGMYYKKVDTDVGIFLESAVPSMPGRNLDEEEYYKGDQIAAFGELSYELSEKLTATFGLRYFKEDIDSRQVWNQPPVLFDFIPDVEFQTTTTIEEALPKILFEYAINDSVLLYATAAKGARNGGLNWTGAATITSFLGFPIPRTYEQDTAWSYEIGAKTSWLDERLTANAALYRVDWDNLQVVLGSPPIPFGPGFISAAMYGNAGDARSVGGELELSYAANDYLSLYMGAAVIDAKILDDYVVNSVSGAFVPAGTKLGFTPDLSVSAAADIYYPLNDALNMIVHADYQYLDSQLSNLGTNVSPGHVAPSYGMVNIRGGVSTEVWSAVIFASNLLDKSIRISNYYGVSENFFINRPRTIGVNFNVKF